MFKRCIGIDIGSSYLRAVQILHRGEEFYIEKAVSVRTRRTTDSPADIIRSLVKQYMFDHRADVAISMPHDTVFFRNLETDSVGAERICDLDSSALEHDFPIQPDEIVAQVCSYRQLPNDKYSVLTAAVPRKLLHERLNILAGAKMHPVLVDAAIFAIHSTVAINHPEIMTGQAIIAHLNESYLTLAVTQNNNILIVRNIPIIPHPGSDTVSIQEQIAEVLPQEAQITWRKVLGGEIEQSSKIYLVSGDSAFDGFETLVEENLHCQITVVNPYAKVKSLPDCNGDAGICVAEGLALRALVPEATTGTNFFKADSANIKPISDLKKDIVICTIFVVAIAVVLLLGLFMRLSLLETKYAHIKNETREIFQNTLPEEKNIVSPLAQLEQKLESLRKDYRLFALFCPNGLSPLKILHTITANIPSQGNMEIDNLLITAESVRLSGTCNSFESVYQWQQLLGKVPGFATVDVQDVQKEPKGEAIIHFTILISSAIQEQK